MCSSSPKPPSNAQDKPNVLHTVRDGYTPGMNGNAGRDKLRIDLNNASRAYGSSLVIPQ